MKPLMKKGDRIKGREEVDEVSMVSGVCGGTFLVNLLSPCQEVRPHQT